MAKKHLVEDEKSNCMKEELLVSLEMGAVEVDENAKGGDRYSKLKNMFRSRIVDYYKTHPEVMIIFKHIFWCGCICCESVILN